jgi:hypothetical protein
MTINNTYIVNLIGPINMVLMIIWAIHWYIGDYHHPLWDILSAHQYEGTTHCLWNVGMANKSMDQVIPINWVNVGGKTSINIQCFLYSKGIVDLFSLFCLGIHRGVQPVGYSDEILTVVHNPSILGVNLPWKVGYLMLFAIHQVGWRLHWDSESLNQESYGLVQSQRVWGSRVGFDFDFGTISGIPNFRRYFSGALIVVGGRTSASHDGIHHISRLYPGYWVVVSHTISQNKMLLW